MLKKNKPKNNQKKIQKTTSKHFILEMRSNDAAYSLML